MSTEDPVIPTSDVVKQEDDVQNEPSAEATVVVPEAAKLDEPTIPVTVIESDKGDIVATTTHIENGTVTVVAPEESVPQVAVVVVDVPTVTDSVETPPGKHARESTDKDIKVEDASTPAPAHTAPNGEQYVTEIRPQDVLFGRGGNAIHHSGNISFRTLIQEKKQIYTSSCRRQVKDMVAVDVYNAVTENGGRFLRESTSTAMDLSETIETPSSGKGGKIWTIADQQTSINKIKQALREVDTNTATPNTPNVPSSVHGVDFVSAYNQGGTPGVGSDADGAAVDEDASLPRKKRKYTKTMTPTIIPSVMAGTHLADVAMAASSALRTYNDSFLQEHLNDFKDTIATMLEAYKQDLLTEIRNIVHGPKTENMVEMKVEEVTTETTAPSTVTVAEETSTDATENASTKMKIEHASVEL
jgi:hypothetical protein